MFLHIRNLGLNEVQLFMQLLIILSFLDLILLVFDQGGTACVFNQLSSFFDDSPLLIPLPPQHSLVFVIVI